MNLENNTKILRMDRVTSRYREVHVLYNFIHSNCIHCDDYLWYTSGI